MAYSVDLSVNAQKFLDKLDKHISERIVERIKRLRENPIPSDAKFMGRHEGNKVFRYRMGDYRALYKVIDQNKIILIVKIDKRPRVYDNLLNLK